MDLLIESHLGLKRQGPGSSEMTRKALSFVELPDGAHIAAFVLPEACWTEHDCNPRKAAEHQLLEQYPGSELGPNPSGVYPSENIKQEIWLEGENHRPGIFIPGFIL